MSGKLEIQNGSLKTTLFVSLLSIDEKETHFNNKILNTGENISSFVKGGTKRLLVKTNLDKKRFWEC